MTKLVAILNLTPDSFSDGRPNASAEDYLTLAKQAIAEGAALLDIGAESTRPGATPLTPAEEWKRLEPVLAALPREIPISLDTRHPETLANALKYNIAWLNDVSGLASPQMIALAKKHTFDIVLMHSLTVPADPKQVLPENCDVIAELLSWAQNKIAALEAEGIARARLIFDPGLGFGKTPEQSWKIIEEVEKLKTLGLPLLIGHSRKSFLKLPMEQRDAATAKITAQLAAKQIDYVRVHNIVLNKAQI